MSSYVNRLHAHPPTIGRVDVEGFAQVNQLFESRRPHSTGAQNPALCKRDNPETSTGLYLLQLSLHTAA